MVAKVPPEVLEHIFLHVDNPSDLFNLRVICKQWHALITNERFLNIYFHNRFGVQSRQPLKWVPYDIGCRYPALSDYNIQYSAPERLQGSGSVLLDTTDACRADFPLLTFPFNSRDYSIGMWLYISPTFEKVTFNMKFNDFSLKFTLGDTYFRVWCSHTSGFQTQARTKVPLRRWSHIILTYSSKFLFYINEHVYPLIYTEEPMIENDMYERTIITDNDRYLIVSYTGHIKFIASTRIADIQVLPCALTLCEIRAIIEQESCIEQLNMGRYLLDHWASIHWYSKYLPNCILF